MDDEDKAIILLASVKLTQIHIFKTLLYKRGSIMVDQVKRALIFSDKMEANEHGQERSDQEFVPQLPRSMDDRRIGFSSGRKDNWRG